MSGQESAGAAIARAIVALSSWVVPADRRADWRREWRAEVAFRAHRSLGVLGFALGAPRHALSLALESWRPSHLVSDVRFAARWLRRRPLFAGASILTLALGIGATTATFSVIDAILLRPLPYQDPGRLVQLWETNPTFNWTESTIAPGNAISWRERTQAFSGIAWYMGSSSRAAGLANVTLEGDDPKRVQAMAVSANFFDVLGVRARIGRTFAADEDVPGHHRVVVLSDQFWRSTWAADPGVLGRDLRLNGVTVKVIGVMPAAFRFDQSSADMWIPLAMKQADQREVRRPHYLHAIARLRPGVSVAAAEADLTRVARALEREHPDTNTRMGAGLGPLDDWFVGQTRRPLLLFFLAVGLVLLIACSNVANLVLLRTGERAGEISLRSALGASRGRLVRQLLAESLVIAGFGTACGVGLAAAAVGAFVRLAPPDLPRLGEVSLHWEACGFAALVMMLTTVLVGLAPAFQGANARPRASLGDGGRTTAPHLWRVRRGLVAGQVALAAVLLVGALMTVRSFRALTSIDPGFPVDGLVTAKVSLPGMRYGAGQFAAFFENAAAAVRAVPGVTAAGATTGLPLSGSQWTGDLFIDGRPDVHGHELRHKSISSGYLEALGVPLVAGRTITAADRDGAPPVVVINRAMAREYFPSGNPVGRRIAFDDPSAKRPWQTIVGVVGDEPQDRLGKPAVPEVYQSNQQEESNVLAIAVRSTLSPDRAVAVIRDSVRRIDPQLSIYDAGAFGDRMTASLARERVSAALIAAFGLAALVLAAVGVYGVAAYSLSARTREIGIRLAFGATPRRVMVHVVRQEATGVVMGLAAGMVLAVLGSRLLGSVLFGEAGRDAVSYGAALMGLFLTGLAACIIPARRALLSDPISTLRRDL